MDLWEQSNEKSTAAKLAENNLLSDFPSCLGCRQKERKKDVRFHYLISQISNDKGSKTDKIEVILQGQKGEKKPASCQALAS